MRNPLDNHFLKKVNDKPACASEARIPVFRDTRKLREDQGRRPRASGPSSPCGPNFPRLLQTPPDLLGHLLDFPRHLRLQPRFPMRSRAATPPRPSSQPSAYGRDGPRQRRTRATTARGHAAAERSHAATARSRRTPPRGEHDGAQGADSRPPDRRAGNRRRTNDAGGRGGNKGRLTPFSAGETSKSSDCRGRSGRRRCRSRPTAAPAHLPLRQSCRTGAGGDAACRRKTRRATFSPAQGLPRTAAQKRGARPRDGDPGYRPSPGLSSLFRAARSLSNL